MKKYDKTLNKLESEVFLSFLTRVQYGVSNANINLNDN